MRVAGEDSLLTLQAQEEQFKKMDKTVCLLMVPSFTLALCAHLLLICFLAQINKISHKAKSSKSTLRLVQCRHCYRKTLFTWFLIVLVLCTFGLFAWYIGSPEIVRKLDHPVGKLDRPVRKVKRPETNKTIPIHGKLLRGKDLKKIPVKGIREDAAHNIYSSTFYQSQLFQ